METANSNIITETLLYYNFCNHIEVFTADELKHLCNIIDYSEIPDRYLSDNPSLYPFIRWERMDKMQAVRIATANPGLIEKISLKRYKYKVREIFFLIQNDHTALFKYFDFDFKTISQDDAYYLFCLGKDDFLNLIDITKYNFSFIESIGIIRAYDYKRDIIKMLNYQELKNYQVAEILGRTGYKNRDLFELNELTTLNWLDLLSCKPEFLKECNFEQFVEGDPFNLIQLIIMFDKPDLSYLLEKIDLNDITPFGWEKLLIYKPEHFLDTCNFSKLNDNNWNEILAHRPELITYKV